MNNEENVDAIVEEVKEEAEVEEVVSKEII
jgi:hypothetical protein